MNGFCDWCEGDGPVTPKGSGEICAGCVAALEAEQDREAAAAEAALPRRERMALQRARDAEVD